MRRGGGIRAGEVSGCDINVPLATQAASKAELLENELDVMGAESTEDRLSGAARLLELTQRCEELQTELASARAGIPQVDHVWGSPNATAFQTRCQYTGGRGCCRNLDFCHDFGMLVRAMQPAVSKAWQRCQCRTW